MNKIFIIALTYLVLVAGFVWGVLSERLGIFPHRYIDQMARYHAGGEGEAGLSLGDKIVNDIELAPHRFVVPYTLESISSHSSVSVPGADPQRGALLIRQTGQQAAGWRVLFGPMHLKGAAHAAILLNAQGEIAHVWPFAGLPDQMNIFPHGLLVLPDGSVIGSFDYGVLEKRDACGKVIWSRNEAYNHMLEWDDIDRFWTINGDNLEQIGMDGSLLKAITLTDIMAANPDTDILSLRQRDIAHPTAEQARSMAWQHDPWHLNDVDPLPADLAPAFPMFAAGDLLISARSLNLIFVIDPDTLRVKWWRMGIARRQHDPDWEKDGTISLYDNNTDRGPSRIIAINPANNQVRVLVDGARHNFVSRIRGNHQVLENGNILIASTQQGRMIEVAPSGDLAMEAVNVYNAGDGKNLAVSTAFALPENYFDVGVFDACR